ncbi:MAG TPA: universal stress protein [Kofleriaceae bacterium]
MKRILVALDGSLQSAKVLAAAVRMAGFAGAQLVLYRAISIPVDLPPEAFGAGAVPLDDLMRRNAHADLERLASELPRDLVEQIVVDVATAWDGICREARERDADLIVLGARGYGRIARFLGTTAAHVADHADRNVLVVRTEV